MQAVNRPRDLARTIATTVKEVQAVVVEGNRAHRAWQRTHHGWATTIHTDQDMNLVRRIEDLVEDA